MALFHCVNKFLFQFLWGGRRQAKVPLSHHCTKGPWRAASVPYTAYQKPILRNPEDKVLAWVLFDMVKIRKELGGKVKDGSYFSRFLFLSSKHAAYQQKLPSLYMLKWKERLLLFSRKHFSTSWKWKRWLKLLTHGQWMEVLISEIIKKT